VIEDTADTHDDHVGEKRRRGHRHAYRRGVQDAIVTKSLERVDEQVAPHVWGFVVMMVLVQRLVKPSPVHETMPVVLQHALHRDGARESDAKARRRRRLAQSRRSSKDAFADRSRERRGER